MCLTIFINIQNGKLYTDHLTGLYNRRDLDHFLRLKAAKSYDHSVLFIVLLDVDHFKEINDIYGHIIGDIALTEISRILQSVCKSQDDFVTRLGGDEFIIVGERKNSDSVKKIVTEINEQLLLFNKNKIAQYSLAVSIGIATSENHDLKTPEDYINAADKNMYHQKQKSSK